jgi:hypothetical protein
MLDETGCEFGQMFPESQCVQLESPEDAARREEALYARIAAEYDY